MLDLPLHDLSLLQTEGRGRVCGSIDVYVCEARRGKANTTTLMHSPARSAHMSHPLACVY